MILILEDDKISADFYKNTILEIDKSLKIVCVENEKSAYELAYNFDVEIFILDICLDSGGSGYHFAEEIRKLEKYEMTQVIFITSISEKKNLAYDELHCYQFLIKPVDLEALKKCIEKTLKYKLVNKQNDTIILEDKNVAVKISKADIIWVEMNFKTIKLHLIHATEKFSGYKYSLNLIEKMLGEDFIRVHKSIIIHKAYIKTADYTNKLITLTDKQTIDIGGKYIDTIKKILR